MAGRALRPVDRLIDDATTLGPANLDRRLPAPTRMDEVGRLTVTLNEMLDRIATSVERQRLFVAMAAHELRTPLASLRAELDITDREDTARHEYREAIRAAQGDVIRLSSLATSLLELATTQEDAQEIERRPVGLRELVDAVVRGVEPLAKRQGVLITLDVPDVILDLDRTRVEYALGNMVTNALVHGGSENPVEIRCRVDGAPEDRLLTVEVLDRGPGLGDEAPERLFEPFVRGRGTSGPGSGLGLATVASAVRGHGGTFGASARGGGGSRFWFALPAGTAAAKQAAGGR